MKNNFFDPKNPIWLNLVRKIGIILNSLILIIGLGAIILYKFPFGYALLLFLALLVIVMLLHLINMLSLNALYNLQQLRINSDETLKIQNEILFEMKINDNQINKDNKKLLKNITTNSKDKYGKKTNKIQNFQENEVQDTVIEEQVELSETDLGTYGDENNGELLNTPKEHPIYGKVFLPTEDLTSLVVIPEGFSAIDEYAFKNNPVLEELRIPISIKYILMQAFYNCPNLKSIYYQGNENDWKSIRIYGNNEKLLDVAINFQEEKQESK